MDDSLGTVLIDLANGIDKGLAIFEPIEGGEDFVFIEFNKIAEELEQINREDVLGEKVTNAFPGIKKFGLFNLFQAVNKDGVARAHQSSFYADDRIMGWRENHIQKLPSGHILTIYSDKNKEIQTDMQLERWANILEHAQWGIVTGSKVMDDMNPTFAKMHGYTREELIGKPPSAVFTKESAKNLPHEIAQAHQKGHHQFEAIHLRKDGSTFPARLDVTAVKNSKSEVIFRIVNVQDITEEKKAEQSLRDSEQLYRSLFDGSSDGIFIINSKGQFTDCNDSFCKMLGYNKLEALQLTQIDLCPNQPTCHCKSIEGLQGLARDGSAVNCTYSRKDGTSFPIQLSVHQLPDRNNERYWAVIRDMSLIRKNQKKEEQQRQELEKILQSLPIPVVLYEKNKHITFLNDRFHEVIGYNVEQISDLKSWSELVYSDLQMRKKETPKWYRLIEKNNLTGTKENFFRVICKNGEERKFEISHQVYANTRIFCFNDITELLSTQKDLEESRKRFKLFMDHFPGAAFIKDTNDEYYFVNKWYSEKFNLPSSKILNTKIASHWKGKEIEFRKQDDHIRKTKLPQDFKDEMITDEGVEYYLTRKFPIVVNDEETMIGGISFDITTQYLMEKEKEEMNRQIVHSTKLASIGELAASIGHEIRNPLAIIQGYTDQIKNSLAKGGVDQALFDRAIGKQLTAIKRITAIVDGLKNFARSDADKIEFFDIRDSINETLDLISFIYRKESIEITKKYKCCTPIISGNFGKFQQVLMNLLSNAKDAGATKIDISTKCIGNSCVLQIQDNGHGIPEDVQNQIFDPFFTTKSFGKGTGLGLGISKSIIEGIDGKISFTTSKDKGTTFSIEMPLETEEKLKAIETKTLEFHPLKGKILIVDDEEDIREILSDYAQNFGLTVKQAADGEEALKTLEREKFDILTTDLKMPNLDGKKLLKLITTHPVKKVVITGNSSSDVSLPPYDATLQKPFDRAQMYSVLASLLSDK